MPKQLQCCYCGNKQWVAFKKNILGNFLATVHGNHESAVDFSM